MPRHRCLWKHQPALDGAIRKLNFADCGPITDAYLNFLIPRWGRLYLATAPFDGGDVTAAEVIPYDLVSTMRQALEHLAEAAAGRATRNAIIRNLRGAASDVAGVCSLVGVIKEAMGPEANDFAVMSLFIETFGVSFADIQELPGARCLGGQVYSDAEIEKMLYPAIQRTLGARR